MTLVASCEPPEVTAPSLAAHALDPSLERVLRRIRLRASRRVAWLRKLWSEEEPPGGTFAVTHGEVDTILMDKDSPQAEAAWAASDPSAIMIDGELEALESAMRADQTSRLAQLERLFGLTSEESDVLQACVALSLDPSLSRLYAYLQDRANRGYVTEEVTGRLFGHGRRTALSRESPLLTWALIEERDVGAGEPHLFAADDVITKWLEGREELDACLVGAMRVYEALSPLANWPVQDTAAFLKRALDEKAVNPVRIRIVGAPGSGRRTLAACVSAELGMRLLAIDADRFDIMAWPRAFLRAQRHAYLNGYAIAWHGDNALQSPWPTTVPLFPVQFVIAAPRQTVASAPGVFERVIEVPIPSLNELRRIWRRYRPAAGSRDIESGIDAIALEGLTVGAVAAVARSGATTPKEVSRAIREVTRDRLDDLVQAIDCPFSWDDLVVSTDLRESLEDIVYEARERSAFWENARARRLFPQGRGLFVLLAGSPGTGKTMACQVLAAALQHDHILRIDASVLVSRYVGELAKNVSRVLSSLPHGAVLLFDEAEGLFGKRPVSDSPDAQDRYCATDSSHLLTAAESYAGVVFLATNQKATIDSAFTRRLRYVLDFPRPDAASRLKIWQKIIQELAGDSHAIYPHELEALADQVEVTGAQIKYAVLSALFATRREKKSLEIRHLVRGLQRELRKEGRGLSERDHERLTQKSSASQ